MEKKKKKKKGPLSEKMETGLQVNSVREYFTFSPHELFKLLVHGIVRPPIWMITIMKKLNTKLEYSDY